MCGRNAASGRRPWGLGRRWANASTPTGAPAASPAVAPPTRPIRAASLFLQECSRQVVVDRRPVTAVEAERVRQREQLVLPETDVAGRAVEAVVHDLPLLLALVTGELGLPLGARDEEAAQEERLLQLVPDLSLHDDVLVLLLLLASEEVLPPHDDHQLLARRGDEVRQTGPGRYIRAVLCVSL